jgi:hypothetical protein
VLKEKNKLSPLNRFAAKEFSKEGLNILNRIGMVDSEGNLAPAIQPTMNVLSKPHAVVKVIFTGGAGIYEHNINYDHTFRNHVSFTITPSNYSIDDETNPKEIIKILEDFVGKSSLKSINVSRKLNVAEAFVVASLLDMERRSSLRAFVDEMPMIHNSYNTNMIWRIINSTSSSIQWFVSIINEIIGEPVTLSLKEVGQAVEQLVEKGILIQNGGLYQLTGEFSLLPGRMIIIDNILSVQISRQEDAEKIISSGFTCVQSGVHDLLFLDYNGKEIIFETITSARLLNDTERFLNCEAYFSHLQA